MAWLAVVFLCLFSILPILWAMIFSCLLLTDIAFLPKGVMFQVWNAVCLGFAKRSWRRIKKRNDEAHKHILDYFKSDVAEYTAVLGGGPVLFTVLGFIHQYQVPAGNIDVATAVIVAAVIVDVFTLVATIVCIQLLNTLVEPAQIRAWYATCQCRDTASVKYPEVVLSLPAVGLAWSAILTIVSLILSMLSLQLPGTTSASPQHVPLYFALPLAGVSCACATFLAVFVVQYSKLLDQSQCDTGRELLPMVPNNGESPQREPSVHDTSGTQMPYPPEEDVSNKQLITGSDHNLREASETASQQESTAPAPAPDQESRNTAPAVATPEDSQVAVPNVAICQGSQVVALQTPETPQDPQEVATDSDGSARNVAAS